MLQTKTLKFLGIVIACGVAIVVSCKARNRDSSKNKESQKNTAPQSETVREEVNNIIIVF